MAKGGTALELPAAVDAVIIGGGIAGVTTAYYLARAGLATLLCEKGRIAGEQSSRNWGWIRKQGRDPRELPGAILARHLWEELSQAVDADIGWHQAGVAYLAEDEATAARLKAWMAHAVSHQLDTRLLSSAETDRLLGQDERRFKAALYTPSDARAEPLLAVPAIARAATALGATILEGCAVRTLESEADRVAGVITEHGAVRAGAVVLAGGIWSAPFLRHLGLDLPQLGVRASVQRTSPAPLITESALGTAGASIRRWADGGYTIARAGAVRFDLVPAAFRHFRQFLPALKARWQEIDLCFGPPFWQALISPTTWSGDQVTPFERQRVVDPPPDHRLLDEVMARAQTLFPELRTARPIERWAGMIDVTPDEIPVLGEVDGIAGLLIATGFSGHGFGFGPAAGYLMAELIQGRTPIVDLTDFRFSRFAEPGGVRHRPWL
jgi:glycine/D-amino acid oxidase-like deaminating enzyme